MNGLHETHNDPNICSDPIYAALFESKTSVHGRTNLNAFRVSRARKIEEIFGKQWFNSKSVLELGCANGNFGLHLAQYGAKITFSDARQSYLDSIKVKNKSARTILLDQDTDWNLKETFDLILHFGILYNLNNWKRDLFNTIKHSKHILLETAVANTEEDFECKINKNIYGELGAFNQIGTLVSATVIENALKQLNVDYKRFDDVNLNTGGYKYDWKPGYKAFDIPKEDINIVAYNDKPIYGGRRFWLIINKNL